MHESARSSQWSMDLRYVGQEFWLQIPVSPEEIAAGDIATINARFNEVHDRRFGHASQEEPLELVNVRLTVLGARPKIAFPKVGAGEACQVGSREIYLGDPRTPSVCPVYRRELIAPGTLVKGPCVIEEYASTTVLFEGDSLTVADTGEMIIKVGQA